MIRKLVWDAQGTQENLIKILQAGQIIVGTSDTIPGLLAPVSEEAFIKLNEIKQRFEKPYIILIENSVYVSWFAKMPANERLALLMNKCWPGPLTLIMKANPGSPSYIQSEQGTIALRVPNHTGILRLLQQVPGLFSTSANKAGSPAPQSIDDIDPEILTMISCIVTDRKVQIHSKPSTILDVTGEKPRVIREGELSIIILEEIYGEKFER